MRYRLLIPHDPSITLEDHKPALLQQLPDRLLKYSPHFYELHNRIMQNGSTEMCISGVYLPTSKEFEAVKQLYDIAINNLPLDENTRNIINRLKVVFQDLFFAAKYPEGITSYSIDQVITLADEKNFVFEGIDIPDQWVRMCAIVDIAILTTMDLKCLNDVFELVDNYKRDTVLPEHSRSILIHRKANTLHLDEVSLPLQDCQECK